MSAAADHRMHLAYYNTDDGIYVVCSCRWEENLGFEASPDAAVAAARRHAPPPAVPDKLVTAAAEAECIRKDTDWATDCTFDQRKHPECALAAAFAALNVEELRKEAQEAAQAGLHGQDYYRNAHLMGADAASDVWITALTVKES